MQLSVTKNPEALVKRQRGFQLGRKNKKIIKRERQKEKKEKERYHRRRV